MAMSAEQRDTSGAPPAAVHVSSEPGSSNNPHDESIRSAAENEIGAAAAASMPAVAPTEPLRPVDPGAAEVIASITRRLGDRATGPDGVTVVSTRELHNLSHSTSDEFAAFRARLCAVLTEAGEAERIVFSDDTSAAAQYRLLGSAYLVTADGFDQWEMYLSLTPVARDFQVWDARGAVRMLRLPRPGQQQITFNPR